MTTSTSTTATCVLTAEMSSTSTVTEPQEGSSQSVMVTDFLQPMARHVLISQTTVKRWMPLTLLSVLCVKKMSTYSRMTAPVKSVNMCYTINAKQWTVMVSSLSVIKTITSRSISFLVSRHWKTVRT